MSFNFMFIYAFNRMEKHTQFISQKKKILTQFRFWKNHINYEILAKKKQKKIM